MKRKIGKIGNIVFYLAVMLETLFVLIDKSNYILQHETRLFRFTFVLFGIKIILTRYSKKEWIGIASAALLGIVSYACTGREEIARVAVMIIACKDTDLKKTMKLIFYETVIGCIIIIGLSLSGIYGQLYIIGKFRGEVEEPFIRYCFGMGHPNALHCMAWIVTLLGMYLYDSKMNWWKYAVVFALNVGLYQFTDSKTGFIILMVTIVSFALFHYVECLGQSKAIYLLGIFVQLGAIVFTVIVGRWGEEVPWIKVLNRALTGRLQLALWEGGVAKWSLFSRPNTIEHFDMGWMRLFYWYGIIPASLFLILLILVTWECYKYKDKSAFLVIMLITLYTVVESHVISVYIGRNYLYFLIGFYWTKILEGDKTSGTAVQV